ncbi:MAG TPA: SRPBCC family protein [Methylothermaceae bacterium]|nr:SRPBCC family protein [Methylothermaceae bacterium]
MRIALIVVLSLVLLLAVALIIGSRLPKTHVAASRIRLRARPEEIWRILTDFEHYPDWRLGLKRVEVCQGEDGKPMWIEVCSRHCKIPFKVVESRPPHWLVTQIADPKLPLVGRWTYELEEENGTTVVTITETDRIFHPLFRFFTRYVISYHGAIDVFLTELAIKLGQKAEIEHLEARYQEK